MLCPIYCRGVKTPSNVVFKRLSLASCAVLLSLSSVAYASPETEKGYILTPVEEQGKNTITKYEFNEETNKLEPVYYQVDLVQTEYGEGDTTKYFEWSEDEYNNYLFGEVDEPTEGKATITVKYDSSNTSSRIENPSGTDYGNLNSNFIGQYSYDFDYSYDGGAIYNTGSIGDINGFFIDNNAEYHGGAIYNISEIGKIKGDFVGNSAVTTNSGHMAVQVVTHPIALTLQSYQQA